MRLPFVAISLYSGDWDTVSCGFQNKTGKTVQGIKLLKKEIKLSQIADDTSLICKTLTNIGNVLAILADFGAVSGLYLNKSKTKTSEI